MISIRRAVPEDLAPLALLWQESWTEAHAAFVPVDLLAHRTLESFQTRIAAYGDSLRTAGGPGDPLGFCTIKTDELDQLYLAPRARGTGLAAALLTDGERHLAAQGCHRAHLLCLKENLRAAAFYTKQGWDNLGLRTEHLDTLDRPFEIKLLRFEKTLA